MLGVSFGSCAAGGGGMTLAELAGRAGCSDSYLSSVEKGPITPTLSALSTLAAVLGADVGASFGGEPEEAVHLERAGSGPRLHIGLRAPSDRDQSDCE